MTFEHRLAYSPLPLQSICFIAAGVRPNAPTESLADDAPDSWKHNHIRVVGDWNCASDYREQSRISRVFCGVTPTKARGGGHKQKGINEGAGP